MSNLRTVSYSSRAAYLRGNRAAYRTTSHVVELPNGQWPAANFAGHRIIKTLCGKQFSDMELHDGNGTMVRELSPKCKVCLAKLAARQREPLPPEVLANALQDRIHEDVGKSRPATSVKIIVDPNRTIG